MKNKLFGLAFMLVGGFAFAANEMEDTTVNSTLDDAPMTICNTQTSTDSDGDTTSVTCCRTTFDEAYDCAAGKLKKAVKGIEG